MTRRRARGPTYCISVRDRVLYVLYVLYFLRGASRSRPQTSLHSRDDHTFVHMINSSNLPIGDVCCCCCCVETLLASCSCLIRGSRVGEETRPHRGSIQAGRSGDCTAGRMGVSQLPRCQVTCGQMSCLPQCGVARCRFTIQGL